MKAHAHRLLHYRADARSVVFVLGTLALLVAQWSGILRHPLVFVGSLALCFTACVINHNHQHFPVFVPALANRVFGVLLSLATGQPAKAIVAMHLGNHHAYTSGEHDHVRASIVRSRWNLLNLVTFPFIAVARFARVKTSELARWRSARPQEYRQLALERWVLYPLLAAALVVRPLDTLAFLLLPYVVAQWGIIAINLVQHDGCDPTSRFNHSRNHVGGTLNWFLFSNGYHTAHHLLPGLHWSELPRLHEQIAGNIHPRLVSRSLAVSLARLYIWPARRPRVEEVAP